MGRSRWRATSALVVAAIAFLAVALVALNDAAAERSELARVVTLLSEHDAIVTKLASAAGDVPDRADPERRDAARLRTQTGLGLTIAQHRALLAGDPDRRLSPSGVAALQPALRGAEPAFARLTADTTTLLRISDPALEADIALERQLAQAIEIAAEDYLGSLAGVTSELRFDLDGDGNVAVVLAALMAGLAVSALGGAALLGVRPRLTAGTTVDRGGAGLGTGSRDELTGLANRTLFRDRLEHAVAQADRSKGEFAVMFLDLDRFKQINDRFGHDAGDAVLLEFARRLESCARRSDTVARLGGDEFTMLLENLDGAEGAATVADKILRLVQEPVFAGEHELAIGTSIGIAMWPNDAREVAELLRHADTAMYAAKAAGRGNYQFSTPALRASNVRRLRLIEQIRTALEEDALELVYQPQVSMASGGVVAVEALVRWREAGELVPAADWLPVIENTELVVPIARWVLATACRQVVAWEELGLDLRVTVNISKRQFRNIDLPGSIADALQETDCPATRLEIELTEDAVAEDLEGAAASMAQVRAMGVRIALDDFGTGLVSLQALRSLPIDTLKIDPSFVDSVDEDETVVAGAIATLAQHFSMEAVAEGVETEGQWEFLHSIAVDRAQGYLVTGALTADEIPAFVRRRLIKAV